MVKIKWIITITIFIFTSVFAQNTYYISSSLGNDSNSGISEKSPFKSIDKINSLNLFPGDKVLFRSGDQWNGQKLSINNSGNESKKIIISSYGTGVKPIINLKQSVPGWNNSANWTNDGNNIWHISGLAASYRILRLWLNGTEVARANGGTTEGSSVYKDNLDGTIGVCSKHPFMSSRSGDVLYVYATSNPATYYSNIEWAGSSENTINVAGDYIVIDGLDIRGGRWASVALAGADHFLIKNCNIGRDANWIGITGQADNISTSDKSCSYVEIANDSIVSGKKIKILFYDGIASGPEQGISSGAHAGERVDHWSIHDCYIKNWSWGIYISCIYSGSMGYFDVHNNDISAPDIAYGKCIQTEFYDTYTGSDIRLHMNFYNNYLHDAPFGVVNESASACNYFFNIISNIRVGQNIHCGDIRNSGYGFCFIQGDGHSKPDSILVFNNTVYNSQNAGVMFGSGDHYYYYNNLWVNNYMYYSPPLVWDISSVNGTFTNNLVYKTGATTSSSFVRINNSLSYTILQWNGLSKSISGNIQYQKSLNNLLNINDFTLPVGSVALNTGINISNLIPSGFKDRDNNLVNASYPNIGAIDNQILKSTDFKVFLEGPYKNGQMSTTLNALGYIPKTQPYNIAPWNYPGTESVSEIPKNIVDWILIELRTSTSPSSIVAKQAAFIRNDGSITALDGVSPLTFNNNLTGSYYVVIRHRNHLSIMSSQLVNLNNSSIVYDFTTSESKAYGQNAMVDLGNGIYGMYGGDINGDGIIDDKDVVDVSQKLFSSGYSDEDSNMNSPVNVLDYKLPKINKSVSSQVQ